MTGWLPGDLVATDAHSARGHLGPCAICGYAMLHLEYVATIAATAQLAHVPCLRQLAPPPQRTRTRTRHS